MVKEYNAKYGGTPSEVNADVAEGYSVGQVLAQAAAATKSLDNKKIIAYLHSGATLDTVQAPVKCAPTGQNIALKALTFQWQDGKLPQTLPRGVKGPKKPVYPKPAWR